MNIVTKTGDGGDTGLFGGRRVRKSSVFIRLVGEVDELCAVVGWCVHGVSGRRKKEVFELLHAVQDALYRVMAIVGSGMQVPKGTRELTEEDVGFLEQECARLGAMAGELRKFIRPGSSEAAARLHIARSVCRRVERSFVEYVDRGGAKVTMAVRQDVVDPVLRYLNRLSDLLFLLAYSFEKEITLY